MNAIDRAIEILLACSGLEQNQAKLAIYYAIATWAVPNLHMFSILSFNGPPGTGKTTAMRILTPWCRNSKVISGKLITPAALRDELRAAYMGTAVIEEADEATNIRDCEQLYAARCNPTTGSS